MKYFVRGALAALLLFGCDDGGSGGGTDAGPMAGGDAGPMTGSDAGPMTGSDAGPMTGSDAGVPITPDMNAQMRNQAANDRIRAVSCGCDMAWFESAAACEAFNTSDAAEACSQSTFMTHFDTVGAFFTCIADLNEDLADCYEAASCDDAALMACDEAADTAAMACPTVPDADAMAFQATAEMCTADDIVGPAGTCPDDSGAVSTTGDAVFMGSTVGAGNDLDAPDGCITVMGGGGSPDRAFRWTAPAAGDYTFDTIGSSFDTVLYVLGDCDGAESLGCNDDTTMGMEGDLRSSVTATLTADQEVLVVVEGFAAGNAGDFVVNINAATP